MSDISADEYYIAAKVCDAEVKPESAQEFRHAAARLIAKSVSEEVEALALIQHEELCTHRKFMGWTQYKPWDKMPKDTRLERYVGIRAVLAHLTATGRLVPAGGMTLTAEQVDGLKFALEAVTSVADASPELRRTPSTPISRLVKLLRALFPATEPAEAAAPRCDAVSIYGDRCFKTFGHDDDHKVFNYTWDSTYPAPAEPAESATQSAGGDCFDVCEGHPVETPDAAGTPIRLTLGTDEITEPWSQTQYAVMSEVGDRVFEIDWDRGGTEEALDCIVGGRLVTRDVHYGAWKLVDSPDPAPAEPAEEETKAEPWIVQLPEAGGMALTAEQVEDVRTVANCALQYGNIASREAADRLRALFPATEPAEDAKPCGSNSVTLGWCKLTARHEGLHTNGTYLWGTPSEPDPPAPSEPAEAHCTVPPEGWWCSRAANHDGPCAASEGVAPWVPQPLEADWLDQVDPRDPQSRTHRETAAAKFAEPAEEETKAEARPPLLTPNQIRDANPGKHQTYIYGQQSADGTACIGCNWETRNILPVSEAVMAHDSAKNWTHDHSVWIAKNGKCPCGQPASSPAVPAPTETGPWQRIEDVPETVGRLTDRDGDIWEWDGDNWVTPETAILPTAYINKHFAPFVAAAEEGRA